MSTVDIAAAPREPFVTGVEHRQAELDASFEAFCRENIVAVERFLRRRCADQYLIQEALQETLITTCAKWEQVRTFERPLGWVYKTAYNKLRKQLDRQRKDSAVSIEQVPADRLAEPTSPHEARELLASWLRRLPPRQAEVFGLAREGYTDGEIARILGIAASTVRAYKLAARLRLQQLATEAGFGTPARRR